MMICSGCRTAPKAIRWDPVDPSAPRTERIYLHNHGRHTGISVPATSLTAVLPGLSLRFPQAEYLEIGWGDAGFYQAEKITSRLTFRAVFLPSDTVMHLVGYRGDPVRFFPDSETKIIFIQPEGLKVLSRFIASSFATDDAGNLLHTRTGIYGDSQFYTAVGSYSLFNTCNKWTAKALVSAGVDMGIAFKVTSGSVMRDLPPESVKP